MNYQHDGLGRVKSETQGTGPTGLETLFEYDAADRPVVTKRRRAENDYAQTRYAYDLLGRRIAVTEADETADARTTTFGYDRLGRMTSQTAVDTLADPDQIQTTRYEYDLVGRRTKVVYPDSIDPIDALELQYNSAGRLMLRRDQSGRMTEYGYDDRGLVVSRHIDLLSESFDEIFNHDGLGRLTQAARLYGIDVSMVTREYNALSAMTLETQMAPGGPTLQFHFEYDQAGNRLCADCPSTPGTPVVAELEYAYNKINRITAITRNGVLLATYDYASSRGVHLDKRRVHLSGGQLQLEYDPNYDEHHRVDQIINRKAGSPATTLAQFDHTFDGLGNRRTTDIIGNSVANEDVVFDYDNLSHLWAANYTTGPREGIESFEQDLLGNRRLYIDTRPALPLGTVYGPNNPANEYPTVAGLPVSYDQAGNLSSNERGYTFIYDEENRLTKVKDPTGAVMASYAYDALGRRVREVKGGKTTYFYYDGQRVFAEYEKTTPTATATLARYYVDGPMYVDEHVLMHEGGNGLGEGEDFYYLLGPLYTVAGLTDMSGHVVQSYSYDAYGGVVTMPAPPTVTAGGGRYLLVTPADQGDTPVALVVVGGSNCPNPAYDNKYVQSKCIGGTNNGQNCNIDADCPKRCVGGLNPNAVCVVATDCPAGDCVGSCDEGTLGPTAFYKLSSQWGTAKVRGLEIRPDTTYSVYAQSELGGGAMLSSAASAKTWKWGDVDDNKIVNVLDVANVVNFLKGSFGPFTFEQINIWGCLPDAVINALDVAVCVDAVREQPFPCGEPTTCGTSDLPPPNPYFFTGRRLDFDLRAGDPGASLADLPPGTIAGSSVLTLYDYRAREYDARHGRFLQRDPAGYVDGMNLYEAFKSNPQKYVDPDGRQVQEMYHLLTSGKFASNAEIERALDSGDIELVNVQSGLLLDLKNASEYLNDPMAQTLSAQGFREGYYEPAVETTTNRFTSVINAQMQAGVSLPDASSSTFLTGLFFGDQFGVTPLLEGLSGVDLASNTKLSAGESFRRGVQGGSAVFIFAAAPMCPRSKAAGMGAGQGDVSLPVLNRHFTPNARNLLQRVTDQQNTRLHAQLGVAEGFLSGPEYLAAQSSKNVARLGYGNTLERMVAQTIREDALLSQVFRHTGKGPRPDFVGLGSAQGMKFDITTNTARSIADHLRRPYGRDLIIITYERPLDFTVFP